MDLRNHLPVDLGSEQRVARFEMTKYRIWETATVRAQLCG